MIPAKYALLRFAAFSLVSPDGAVYSPCSHTAAWMHTVSRELVHESQFPIGTRTVRYCELTDTTIVTHVRTARGWVEAVPTVVRVNYGRLSSESIVGSVVTSSRTCRAKGAASNTLHDSNGQSAEPVSSFTVIQQEDYVCRQRVPEGSSKAPVQFYNVSLEDAKNGNVVDPNKEAFAANKHLLCPLREDGALPPLKKFSIRICFPGGVNASENQYGLWKRDQGMAYNITRAALAQRIEEQLMKTLVGTH
ncbi:hypothetical protein C8Q76DRAFT_798668 [Earliella scabrosa]|nr:hypothetical protein C8Q76DRAFT_798668 [Earliella scabrosa]